MERRALSIREFTRRGRIPGRQAVAEHLAGIGSAKAKSVSRIAKMIRGCRMLTVSRCMPQVHGAVRGALGSCGGSSGDRERGSATDNPLVFPESGDVISGGNFHGAPLALALDYAAIALTDLMSISEAANRSPGESRLQRRLAGVSRAKARVAIRD